MVPLAGAHSQHSQRSRSQLLHLPLHPLLPPPTAAAALSLPLPQPTLLLMPLAQQVWQVTQLPQLQTVRPTHQQQQQHQRLLTSSRMLLLPRLCRTLCTVAAAVWATRACCCRCWHTSTGTCWSHGS
jgi:hypothetical protein